MQCDARRQNVQSVKDTRNVTEDGQENADEDLSTASSLEEDTERREDNGEDDLDDVAVGR